MQIDTPPSPPNTDRKPRARDSAFVERYGPWAVVTGASDGIGRAFAEQLAAMGMNMVLVARRGDVLQDLAQRLHTAHGIAYRVTPADLSDPAAARRTVESTDDLDVGLLVAAAGFGSSGPLLAADLGAANYAATKAYAQSLAEGLQREWAGAGIDVIASAPGPIASGFAARARMRMAQAQEPAVVARQTLAALGRRGTVRPGGCPSCSGGRWRLRRARYASASSGGSWAA